MRVRRRRERRLVNRPDDLQQRADQRQRQADYVEVAALDAGNPAGGAALDGVGAGLVHGLAGGNVGGDLFVGEGEEADRRGFGGYFDALLR